MVNPTSDVGKKKELFYIFMPSIFRTSNPYYLLVLLV